MKDLEDAPKEDPVSEKRTATVVVEREVSNPEDIRPIAPIGHSTYTFSEEKIWGRMLPRDMNPGYHLDVIPKGVVGEVSKIQEEVYELRDAESQGSKIMVLNELADIIGAVDAYLHKHFRHMHLDDVVQMATITKRAFTSGKRK